MNCVLGVRARDPSRSPRHQDPDRRPVRGRPDRAARAGKLDPVSAARRRSSGSSRSSRAAPRTTLCSSVSRALARPPSSEGLAQQIARRRRAGDPAATSAWSPSTWLPGGRDKVPRRVRGAAQEDHRRAAQQEPRRPLHRRDPHARRRRRRRRRHGRCQHPEAALSRGELQCIGATTLDEYRKHIEKDAALERRFQPIMVDEPTSRRPSRSSKASGPATRSTTVSNNRRGIGRPRELAADTSPTGSCRTRRSTS